MAVYQAVLLDLDGTLIDSEALHEEVDQQVFDECGIAVPPHLWPSFKGRTSLDVFTDVCTRFGSTATPGAMIDRKRVIFLDGIASIPLFDGARALLENLHAARIPVALVTSTERALVTPILAHHGLKFDATVTADDVTHTKPHPEPYRRGAAALGVEASCCLAVEDSISGIASAKAAGCGVAALAGSFSADALRATEADAVCNTLAEVHLWLLTALRV